MSRLTLIENNMIHYHRMQHPTDFLNARVFSDKLSKPSNTRLLQTVMHSHTENFAFFYLFPCISSRLYKLFGVQLYRK